MGRKLTPLRNYTEGAYPKAKKGGSLRGVLVIGAMTATSLGGCGPALDSRTVDMAVDAGDLDGAVVDCNQSPDHPDCQDAATGGSAGTANTGGSGAAGGSTSGTAGGDAGK
ncbi:MAG: hypothetical protein JRI68_16645 [Deltaproteobacteria bacterium]|nr:hypothetical protein [Deltaproteobacteria bacterium]